MNINVHRDEAHRKDATIGEVVIGRDPRGSNKRECWVVLRNADGYALATLTCESRAELVELSEHILAAISQWPESADAPMPLFKLDMD